MSAAQSMAYSFATRIIIVCTSYIPSFCARIWSHYKPSKAYGFATRILPSNASHIPSFGGNCCFCLLIRLLQSAIPIKKDHPDGPVSAGTERSGWSMAAIKAVIQLFYAELSAGVSLMSRCFHQSSPLTAVEAATQTIMITAPAMPAGDSLSPSRKNAKHAVITGHSVCSSATDRSEILVSARFCIR